MVYKSVCEIGLWVMRISPLGQAILSAQFSSKLCITKLRPNTNSLWETRTTPTSVTAVKSYCKCLQHSFQWAFIRCMKHWPKGARTVMDILTFARYLCGEVCLHLIDWFVSGECGSPMHSTHSWFIYSKAYCWQHFISDFTTTMTHMFMVYKR